MVAKPGSLMTVTIAAKKNMTKISKEKQYWQQLAKEYEKKIELLKQAKASAQTRKKEEQQAILNETSRNLDNNEVIFKATLGVLWWLIYIVGHGLIIPGVHCAMHHIFTWHRHVFGSLCRLRSHSVLYPYMGQISIPELGWESVCGNVNKP